MTLKIFLIITPVVWSRRTPEAEEDVDADHYHCESSDEDSSEGEGSGKGYAEIFSQLFFQYDHLEIV